MWICEQVYTLIHIPHIAVDKYVNKCTYKPFMRFICTMWISV